MAFDAHQLAHDLRIRLAAEVVIVRAGAAEHLAQRAMDGAFAGAVGQQNGAVDVEENELHVFDGPSCT